MTAETVVDDPLVETIARAVVALEGYDREDAEEIARAVLAAIAETGRLLPEGGEDIGTEYGIRWTDGIVISGWHEREHAQHEIDTYPQSWAGAKVVERSLFAGDWEAAS